MEKKEYLVMFSASYRVDAENEEEALKKADDMLMEEFNSGVFPFEEEII